MHLKALTITLSLAAIGLTPIPAGLFDSLVDFDQAQAKGNGGGNGAGNGGGNGGGKPDKPNKGGKSDKAKKPSSGNGALASELKGLNAYHASNTAFSNAAPNSRVGRLAAYREAALAAAGAQDAIDEAQTNLDAANQALADANAALDEAIAAGAPQEDIDLLQDAADQAALDAESAQTALDEAVADAEGAALTEEEALLSASDGRVLSRGTIEYLREQLGITGADEPAL